MKTLLFILVSFVGLTAFISGLILIYDSGGGIMQMSTALLASSPFRNFIIPGVVLAFVVGGTNLLAVYFNLRQHRHRYNWAMAGGVMIIGWIIVQALLINTIFWLQFVYLAAGLLILLIAYQLKGKWAV